MIKILEIHRIFYIPIIIKVIHKMLRSFSIYYCVTVNTLKHNFNRNRDIIIHHGLMGNAKNFRTISKNPSISNYCNS